MKPAPFGMAVAADRASALAHLGEPGAKPLSGGQSLGPMLNLRLARPALLVEISGVRELRAVVDEGDAVLYGAATTHAEIEDGAVPDATPGWMRAVAGGIAYRAVRNRGTIGGSVAHADPAADWLVTLAALGAAVVIAGLGGTRTVAMTGFVTGPFATALEPGEIVAAIRVPKPGPGARWGYWKFTRKLGEFAKASAAVLLDGERTRIALGALELPPMLLPDPAALLRDPSAAGAALRTLLPDREDGALALHEVALVRAIVQARDA